MIDSSPRMLLYIEPQNPKSETPIVDELTQKMTAAFRNFTTGGGYDSQFVEHAVTMGWHTCICGAKSSDVDYLLPSGFITNSLSIHYLAWHRGEVPESEIIKIALLPNEYQLPTTEQLQ